MVLRSLRTQLQTFLKILIVFTFVISYGSHGWAQSPNGEDRSKQITGPRKQLATILFAGLGGAILGLSTLSFYGRPQDKLSNIAIGAAIGVITGTSYVTYKAATNPSDLYAAKPLIELENDQRSMRQQAQPLRLSYALEF